MAVYYLEADEEVTGAVARLRSASGTQVAFVLPAGSRVATSRINFRLLFREAESQSKRLAVVSGDSSARAIAMAAGLAAYATVAEYEEVVGAAPERPVPGLPTMGSPGVPPGAAAALLPAEPAMVPAAQVEPPAPGTGVRATAGRDVRGGPASTASAPDGLPAAGWSVAPATWGGGVPEPPTPAAAAGPIRPGSRQPAGTGGGGALPVVGGVRRETKPRRSRRRGAVVLLGVGGLIVAGAVAGWILLPAAEIVVTPLGEPAGPVSLTVIADPDVDAVDEVAGVVPAQRVEFPLAAKGTFRATGSKVEETTAAGTVRFSSNNPLDSVTIPAGTTVSTGGGVQFQTVATVVAPRATISGTTITAGRVEARIQAVAPGPEGNVAAGRITVVPSRFKNLLVSVTNPAATSGGSRTETKFVTKEDTEAAAQTLNGRLDSELDEAVSNPAVVPEGTTAYPETAKRGKAEFDPLLADLVGTETATFELTATATGTVIAVDLDQIGPVAEARLAAQVTGGLELFQGSVRTQVGDGTVDGATVRFPVQAVGEQWRPVAAAELLALIRGKPVDEAKTLLAPYGEVTITPWPDFVDTIPTMDNRITITVAPPRRVGS